MKGFKLSLFVAFISCLAYIQAGVFDGLSSEEYLQLCTMKKVNYEQMKREANKKLKSLKSVQENCNGPQREAVITDIVKEASKCLGSEPAPNEIQNTVLHILEHGCALQENRAFSQKLKQQCPAIMEFDFKNCMDRNIPKLPEPTSRANRFFSFLSDKSTNRQCALIKAGAACREEAIRKSCDELLNEFKRLMINKHMLSHC